MRLDTLPLLGSFDRSRDELLSEQITAFFLGHSDFPVNEAEINFFGHDALPPTVYDVAWKLEPSELWLAHRVGTIYHGVNAKGEFSSAGAAAILVSDKYVRLMLGVGAYTKSGAMRGSPSEGTHLEHLVLRFIEFSGIGMGDLLILEHWKLGKLYLKIPWARSFAALIAGLRAVALQPKILENSVVFVPNVKRLGASRGLVLENVVDVLPKNA